MTNKEILAKLRTYGEAKTDGTLLRFEGGGWFFLSNEDSAADFAPTPDAHSEVGVKDLEWEYRQTTAEALTPFGEYQVAEYTETDGIGYAAVFDDNIEIGEFATAKEAHDAAQADFAKRVQSCLTAGVAKTEPAAWRLMEDGEPTEPGYYRVMIGGDSDSEDGHILYEYPDYTTWGEWYLPEDHEDKGHFTTPHDEAEGVFAYYGPLAIPDFVL